ncbi:hypothetical protein M1B72_07795 [Geomonas paludis]|uniref:Lipoprotein n=1 Tax=Geomonas paludis TaxID=2740185 RepID=A0A6V8MXA1_9BACT|nr:hypothetical protein [Geomonas paludis]UPU37599.1 hypothetical protein M1B72_07795 [Geomonas paludis]GFO63869.1 hypothetical protein GMPD_17880 [Geomonas paludis]
MKRTPIAIVLLLLSQVVLSCAGEGEVVHRGNGKFLPDQRDVEVSPTQENACDCCQKCKAAKKDIKPHLEEDTSKETGCEECCRKCGRPVQPLPEDIPPEIINKPAPK